jgi:hypothetical protein
VLWTAVAGIVVPLGTIFVLSFFSSLWLPRFFVFAGPLAAILLARGCFTLRVQALGGVVAAALLLIQGYGLFRYDRAYQKEPWRDVAREVRSQAAGQPATVLAMFDAEAFSFYLRDAGHQVEVVEMSHPDVIANAGYREEQLDEMEAQARRWTEGSREVWVIGGSLITPDRREAFDRAVMVAGTGREHRASERWRWHGSTSAVRVERFVRRDPATPASPPPATVERRAPR